MRLSDYNAVNNSKPKFGFIKWVDYAYYQRSKEDLIVFYKSRDITYMLLILRGILGIISQIRSLRYKIRHINNFIKIIDRFK